MVELPEELQTGRPARKAGQEPTARLTLEAYLRLKAELEELTTLGRDAIAERSRSRASTAISARTRSTTPRRTSKG